MTTVALRDAIIAGLKANVPRLQHVAKIEGNITNKDAIRKLSARAPAAFVAITGMTDIQKVGVATFNANCTCAVFIMTAGLNRIEDYNSIVEQIILAALENDWGLEWTRYPTDISAEVIYNDDVQLLKEKTSHFAGEGVLLAGIAWNQRTRITRVDRADDIEERDMRGETIIGTFPEEPVINLDGEIVSPTSEISG